MKNINLLTQRGGADPLNFLAVIIGIIIGLAVGFGFICVGWWLIGVFVLVWLPFWPYVWLQGVLALIWIVIRGIIEAAKR